MPDGDTIYRTARAQEKLRDVRYLKEAAMEWNGCADVEVIPGKVSGVPLVRGSRVQADSVVESFLLGESVEEIAYDYDLDREIVESVLRFAMAHRHSVAA